MVFRVGMKVVCVSLKTRTGAPLLSGENYPKLGGVYTIRETFAYKDRICLVLDEITNEPRHTTIGFREPGYNSANFRPVISRKTSIEIFERLLTPSPARVQDLCGND